MKPSRLETVRRVALVRETAARAAAAALQRAHAEAGATRVARVEELSRTGFRSGSAQLALADGAQRGRLSASVTDASADLAAADVQRLIGVQSALTATRNARLLDKVCDRHRSEALAAGEAVTQRLLDDLSGKGSTA